LCGDLEGLSLELLSLARRRTFTAASVTSGWAGSRTRTGSGQSPSPRLRWSTEAVANG